eukprot:5355771-Prymnesium_polylepis.1
MLGPARVALAQPHFVHNDTRLPSSTHDPRVMGRYPLLMWPVAFPTGKPLRFADGTLVDRCSKEDGTVPRRDDGKDVNILKAGLFLLLQPERRDCSNRDGDVYTARRDTQQGASDDTQHNEPGQHLPGAFVLVRSHNPYRAPFPRFERSALPHGGDRGPWLWRRYSRFELMGKLGAEVMLNYMSMLDHRRWILGSRCMQRRFTARMGDAPADGGDGAADGAAADAGPADVQAGPADDLHDDYTAYDADDDGVDEDDDMRSTYLPATEVGSP